MLRIFFFAAAAVEERLNVGQILNEVMDSPVRETAAAAAAAALDLRQDQDQKIYDLGRINLPFCRRGGGRKPRTGLTLQSFVRRAIDQVFIETIYNFVEPKNVL